MMRITIEISVFPLDKNYSPVIRSFIDSLKSRPGIEVILQPMSTLLVGDYDDCMHLIQHELKKVFESDRTAISIVKLANLDLTD